MCSGNAFCVKGAYRRQQRPTRGTFISSRRPTGPKLSVRHFNGCDVITESSLSEKKDKYVNLIRGSI